MNTTQLACFIEVAATLSFSKAASNLQVSQPTVSHQIKSLEDELGRTLVVRSTRSVALTDEGMSFVGYAHDILDLAMQAKRRIAMSDGARTLRLRIGASDGLEMKAVSRALEALVRSGVEFEPIIRMAPHAALVDMVEEGAIDAALEFRDPEGAPAAATVLRKIREAPASLVCSVDDAELGGWPQGEQIDLDTCIASGRFALCAPRMVPSAIRSLQGILTGRVDVQRTVMCPSVEAVLALAASGYARTLLPDVAAMHDERLRFIPVRGLDPVVAGARVRRGRQTRLVERFIDAL